MCDNWAMSMGTEFMRGQMAPLIEDTFGRMDSSSAALAIAKRHRSFTGFAQLKKSLPVRGLPAYKRTSRGHTKVELSGEEESLLLRSINASGPANASHLKITSADISAVEHAHTHAHTLSRSPYLSLSFSLSHTHYTRTHTHTHACHTHRFTSSTARCRLEEQRERRSRWTAPLAVLGEVAEVPSC